MKKKKTQETKKKPTNTKKPHTNRQKLGLPGFFKSEYFCSKNI